MSVFHYKAYNASGQAISGALEADNVTTLETRLKEAGVWLLEAREGVSLASAPTDKPSSVKIKRSDLIAFLYRCRCC